ncbi:LolA family protein [Heyndrickxia ginsengihumi]|uniref:Outer membrane lipoprotein carrier protein LolA n=1 Tax=Heyndrickxia ginsengihumi TaxID=363870 RepID=A0A0A6VAR5_9BACI|nr:outer membrane lipoprotein carrier protein LolA [Heyndrickxia ginsengihumi]KHD84598.1 sporulation protein [Heyndrickxia ginsengihumi]MBE6184320.1 outer membrane lipoprotein carrier protein LolA [Bacillus sp. (in: firmicutes)]MCM3024811.1 outer membrane lipoprotein carrier protein LolA [Heyndrickxia ginsengihumi]NEY21614.1 outer membrane lipoprotein carrier protein LolA [Heyndrickxia ginsengihumi]
MKKTFWIVVVAFAAMLVLSACGSKSKEDIVSKLDEKASKLQGYKLTAKMTLNMGDEPRTYNIDVWHNKPDYYRVSLKNGDKGQSQMILRNKEGVYVVTPALNKSYKFQSEWPNNTSQAYLYESLVKDIIKDKNAKLTTTKNQYVFETKTRYQNHKMLPYQKITFDKRTLAPVSVVVMDTDHNPLVKVKFSKVDMKAKFDNNAFDTRKNMTGAKLEIPVDAKINSKEFSVKYPTAKIGNTKLLDEQEVSTTNGKRAVLTYTGDKSYTLIQERSEVMPTSSMDATPINGDVVNLGFTFGILTDHSISWSDNGVDYMVASKHLTKDEMVEIAQSVQGEPEK